MLCYVICTFHVKLIRFRLQMLLPPLCAHCRELFAKFVQQNAEQNCSVCWYCVVWGKREHGKDKK